MATAHADASAAPAPHAGRFSRFPVSGPRGLPGMESMPAHAVESGVGDSLPRVPSTDRNWKAETVENPAGIFR